MSELMSLKVLVQWLPTETLRLERRLTHGVKAGGKVQQVAIKLHRHQPLFPKALALANHNEQDGMLRVKVGFRADTRFTGTVWKLEGGIYPAPGLSEIFYFPTEPSLAELLDVAWRTCGEPEKELALRTKTMEKLCSKLLANHQAGVDKAIENRAPSLFYSKEAFEEYTDRMVQLVTSEQQEAIGEAVKKATQATEEAFAAGTTPQGDDTRTSE